MPNQDASDPPARILIVDDHPAVREALALRIAKARDLVVCGEAADMADALELVHDLKPDLAVVDLALKTSDGLDLIKSLRARHEPIRILVWSMHSESLYAERALRAGAQGYVTKEQATDMIVEAIRQVLAGKTYLSPAMTEHLLQRIVGGGSGPLEKSCSEVLSDRELEVLRLIGLGHSTASIAIRLHLSVKTVETYRIRIRQKLDIEDGTALAHFAMQWVLENK